MRLPDLRNPKWRKRAWLLLTAVVVVLLALHPELRLLLPLLDAIGLDVIVALLGMQFASFLSNRVMPAAWLLRACLARAMLAMDRVSLRSPWLREPREFFRYGVFHWIHPLAWYRVHATRLTVLASAS